MIITFKDKSPVLGKDVFIEASAQVIGDIILGDEVNIWFNAVLRGDVNYIKIGDRTNIQDCCVCHVNIPDAPLIVGDDVTVGHGAIIHGCTIEDVCLIGMGATVLDKAVIGKGSIVAAGALVLENQIVPERSLVAGVPAKIKRMITDEEFEFIKESATHYVQLKNEYKR